MSGIDKQIPNFGLFFQPFCLPIIELPPPSSQTMQSTAESTAQIAEQHISTGQKPANSCWEKIAIKFGCDDPENYLGTPWEKCALKTRGKALCCCFPCLLACGICCCIISCCIKIPGRKNPCDHLSECCEGTSRRYDDFCTGRNS